MNILACCVVQTIQEVVFSVLMSEILVFYLYLTFICVLECIVNAYSLLNFLQLRLKKEAENQWVASLWLRQFFYTVYAPLSLKMKNGITLGTNDNPRK